MAVIHKEVPGTVYEKVFKCDNEACGSETDCGPAYTLSGGYGSTVLDCEPDLTFCSLGCLREWVTAGPFKDILT